MAIDLTKSATNFTISLKKVGVEKMPELEMAVAMDVSGSFDDEHRDGVTNDLVTRLVPWGLTFDPDRKVDFFTYSTRDNVQLVGSVDESNYQNYIKNKVIGKVKGYGLGTGYAPVTRLILQHFGWLPGLAQSSGFLGGLFGKKKEGQAEKRRAIVFFITDGDNNDHGDPEAMMRVMGDADNNGYEVFFVFVGVSNQNVSFQMLKTLNTKFKNAAFREINDIKGFVAKSDAEINDFFLDSKLVSWLKK